MVTPTSPYIASYALYEFTILHHTFYISETWGLDQPSIGTYSEESGSLMIFIDSNLRTRHIYVKFCMYMTYSEESGGSMTSIDSYLRTRHIHESAHYGLNVGLYSSSSYDQTCTRLSLNLGGLQKGPSSLTLSTGNASHMMPAYREVPTRR